MPGIRRILCAGAAASALVATPMAEVAHAQSQARSRSTIAVGSIVSEGNCTLYKAVDGHRQVYANYWMYASSTSWTTWFYRDCQDNFAGVRNALTAALTSSGNIVVGSGGYTVSGRISGVSGDGGPAPYAPDMGTGGFAVTSSGMMVEMDVTVKDRSGKVIYGALVTKTLETGSDINADGLRAWSSMSGQATYAALQRAVTLAVARKVAFKLHPLRVTAVEGRNVQFNYGGPFLSLGMLVDVTSPGGGSSVRYRVTSAAGQSAIAQPYSDGDLSRIVPGSEGVAIEPDSPEASGRRFQKVDLP